MTIASFAHKTNSKALWNVEILPDSRYTHKLKLVKAQVKREWSFSNLVSLLRHSLGYYYDLVPFLENPERVAASSFVGGHSPPGQLQLNLV